MEFTLRDFRRDDFQTLWEIDQRCFPPGIAYSEDELNYYIRNKRSFTLVAESALRKKDGSPQMPVGSRAPIIVGFLVAEAGRAGRGHIITIDVLSPTRRSGVGSELLSAAEARLRTAHCQSVYLETAVENLAALAFYERHGYSVVKTVPGYYSNGQDAMVLQKDLLSPAEAS